MTAPPSLLSDNRKPGEIDRRTNTLSKTAKQSMETTPGNNERPTAIAEKMQQQSIYFDVAPVIGAREYIGCFSVADVRKHLGQPPPAKNSSLQYWQRMQVATELKRQTGIDSAEDLVSVVSEHHFRPSCLCAESHRECDDAATASDSTPPHDFGDSSTNTPSNFLESLRFSATQGCWFCSVIYGGIKACPQWDSNRRSVSPMTTAWGGTNSLKFPLPGCKIEFFGYNDPVLDFYTEYGESKPRCKLFPMREELPDPTNISELRTFVQKNFERCNAMHTCKDSRGSGLPTRLLDIQITAGKYAIRLVETRDFDNEVAKQPYVTLSHCWGRTPISKTTDATLEMNKKGIEWSALPQTFKDAIAITHLLGYRYLWIDALCIIQGNRSDWEFESARMNRVYANCDLMLSGDRGADGSAGLFPSSDISINSWEPLLSPETQHGTRVRFEKRHRIAGSMFFTEEEAVHISPLHKRAWCFQEYQTAPRILHFAIDELMWTCQGGFRCQCGSVIADVNDKSVLQQYRVEGCTPANKASIWKIFVFRYSERTLTNWTDRLPAISGLAKQFLTKDSAFGARSGKSSGFAQSVPDKSKHLPFDKINLGSYLAGLWSNDLIIGLCWRIDDGHQKRIPTYVAPSWSWASVRGRVNWPSNVEPEFEVADAVCETSGLDPTGTVSAGYLTLRARTIPLSIIECNQDGGPRVLVRGHDPDLGYNTDIETYHPDTVPDETAEYPAFPYYRPYRPSSDHRVIESNARGVLMSDGCVMVVSPSGTGGVLSTCWCDRLQSL
jgi:hypothetical protein